MTEPTSSPIFLRDYVSYDQLTRILKAWADAHPEFVRLSSLGKTEAGREVWLLEVGKDPDRARPAICIDANMHSAELLGTNAALCIAQALIDLHLGTSPGADGPPARLRDAARECLYYIIPRVTPDGAEDVLANGRLSRSAPRRRRPASGPHWVRKDMDGDGQIRQIRMEHPAGEFVRHPQHPHVLVARTIDDEGPFYKVFPEGHIEGFDGRHIPFAHTLSDNDSDFNRNFPHRWSASHEGAGEFPGDDFETAALIGFATRLPHIFAWLNLHTFGGIFIRPPFSGSAADVSPEDLGLYEHAAALALRHTGMITVSAFDDMTPLADRPMTGTLAAWAYGDRGCFAWAVELWDLFAAAGLPKRRPYFKNYALQQRHEISALVEWDAKHNEARVFAPWRRFAHPQLGDVEIGGIDPVRGLINPPENAIAPICRAVSSFAVALASLGPRLEARLTAERIAPDLTKLELLATNSGYLPTYVSAISRTQPWNSPLQARVRTDGCKLLAGPEFAELGHLRGWGRGDDEEANGPFFQKSQAVNDISLTWLVTGQGLFTVEVGSPRTGWQTLEIALGHDP
jgi:hypothetical protein